MKVNTKTVTGRRDVHYQSYAELLADAERIARIPDITTLGNWSVGQIFQHLSSSLESCIDGTGFKLPWPARVLFSLLMKRKFLYGKLPAGFKAPKNFQPDAIDTPMALGNLRKAVERLNTESIRAMHPAFGMITQEEWDQFNLRHCELHMSFITEAA